MNVLEKAMRDPNSLVDEKFIEAALSELESDIVYIEQHNLVNLVGDRADFDRACRDWRLLTKLQASWAMSNWRASIRKRYIV